MTQPKIITEFTRMWLRELFELSRRSPLATDIRKHLDLPRVYVLYRDEHPYYVGQIKGRLYNRIWNHANRPQSRYFNFWNFVSAFVVPNRQHVDQVEGLLITIMATANRVTPKIRRIQFPLKAWKAIHRSQQKINLP